MKNCKENWSVNLDDLTDDEFDLFVEHTFRCLEHEEILSRYEKGFEPIVKAAFAYEYEHAIVIRKEKKSVNKNENLIGHSVVCKDEGKVYKSQKIDLITKALCRTKSFFRQSESIVILCFLYIGIVGFLFIAQNNRRNHNLTTDVNLLSTESSLKRRTPALYVPETISFKVTRADFKNSAPYGPVSEVQQVIVPSSNSIMPNTKTTNKMKKTMSGKNRRSVKPKSLLTQAEAITIGERKTKMSQEAQSDLIKLIIEFADADLTKITGTNCVISNGGLILESNQIFLGDTGKCVLRVSARQKYEITLQNDNFETTKISYLNDVMDNKAQEFVVKKIPR